jgi:hypothetical protein
LSLFYSQHLLLPYLRRLVFLRLTPSVRLRRTRRPCALSPHQHGTHFPTPRTSTHSTPTVLFAPSAQFYPDPNRSPSILRLPLAHLFGAVPIPVFYLCFLLPSVPCASICARSSIPLPMWPPGAFTPVGPCPALPCLGLVHPYRARVAGVFSRRETCFYGGPCVPSCTQLRSSAHLGSPCSFTVPES